MFLVMGDAGCIEQHLSFETPGPEIGSQKTHGTRTLRPIPSLELARHRGIPLF